MLYSYRNNLMKFLFLSLKIKMYWKLTGWKILHMLCFIISGFIMIQIHKLTPVFIHNYINPVYLCGFIPLLLSTGFHIHYTSDNKLSNDINV